MGFSYDEWKQVFYPIEMRARNYLAYYSRIFNAVEIDSTFYGTPRETTVQRWANSVPVGFRFCLKTPKSITHDAGLVGVQDEMKVFLDSVRTLGDRLGGVLLQFPPSFHSSQLGVLETFLAQLPRDIHFAVEIRDISWFILPAGESEPPLARVLTGFEVCWTATQYPGLPARIYPTTDWLYIRWIGQHGSYEFHDHERVDRSRELRDWSSQVKEFSDRLAEVYGFTNNDYAGFAAGTADRLMAILELPRRDYRPPRQAIMF